MALWVLRPCWLQPHGPYLMPICLAVLAFHSTPHLYLMTARIWETLVFYVTLYLLISLVCRSALCPAAAAIFVLLLSTPPCLASLSSPSGRLAPCPALPTGPTCPSCDMPLNTLTPWPAYMAQVVEDLGLDARFSHRCVSVCVGPSA